MFRLTIDLPPAPATSAHPDREAARADLLSFFAETRRAHRVTEASWTHTSYDIIDPACGQAICGRAAIDEVCACEHTHREHDDIGCTMTVVEHSGLTDCECRGYQPISADPALFDLDTLLEVPGPT
jgi:hypothetical protein